MTHTVRKLFLWALAGVILLAAVAVGLLRLFLPIFQFPRPTGPYAIGTLTYHWVDAERAEIFTDAPDDEPYASAYQDALDGEIALVELGESD